MNPALDRWTTKDDKSLTEILGLEDENTKPVGSPQSGRPSEVNLRILAVEPEFPDDLSTIANDTLNGSLPPPPPPNSYEIRYYHTPSKHSNDEDGNTMPETPPKYVQSSLAARSYTKGMEGPCSRRFQRILTMAVLCGCILLAAIAVMSLSLYRLRNEPSTNQRPTADSTSLEEFANANDIDISNFEPVTTTTTMTTTAPPPPPPTESTMAPVNDQTLAPTDPLSPKEWILSQFAGASPQEFFSTDILQDTSTVQYQVVDWMSLDPSLPSYDVDRLVQRFALGVVYSSLTTVNAAIPGSWMTYTDECQWPLSRSSRSLCDDDGIATELYLEDMGFNGTIASEIGLLTGLEHLYLTSNNLGGSLPSQVGLLTQLERLNLPRNALQGFIPAEIGQLSSLGTSLYISNDTTLHFVQFLIPICFLESWVQVCCLLGTMT